MSLHIHYNANQVDLVHQAKEKLNEVLEEVMVQEQRPVLLLLSGGSDLALLRNIDCLQQDIFSPLLTVSTLDERFHQSPHENNYIHITNSSFFQEAEDAGVHFIRTVPEDNEKLSEFAIRIEQAFRDWYEINRDGKIIITQGIGGDGHTAGMNVTLTEEEFAHDFVRHGWITGYTSKKLIPARRITVTTTFLETMVYSSIMYVVGDEKAWALRELMKEEFNNELFTLPARIVHQMRDVHLFTDVDIL